ncbi:MAG TPA: DinB family protein [Gemmatimonadaceae bacterium]|nr:DinB family protein [Gemmatimonadaceae bacterium]
MTSIELGAASAQGRFLIDVYLKKALAGLNDTHRALEPSPGLKTAGWLVGHLAVTGDFGRKLCGLPALCPREWRAAFNPGSTPSPNAADYPAMSELCDTVRAVYDNLTASAQGTNPAALAAVNPFVPAQRGFPTAGHFVGYLMTGHFALHLGQLLLWRAAAGVRENKADAAA